MKTLKNLVPIKTNKQLQKVSTILEDDSYYLSADGDIVILDKDLAFSKVQVERNYDLIVDMYRKQYKEARKFIDKAEAFRVLNSLKIHPMRLH
jgi:hypothetical protein